MYCKIYCKILKYFIGELVAYFTGREELVINRTEYDNHAVACS